MGKLIRAYEKILVPTYEVKTLDKANDVICTALQKLEKLVREERIPDPEEYQELHRKSKDQNAKPTEQKEALRLMDIRRAKYAKDCGTTMLKAHRELMRGFDAAE